MKKLMLLGGSSYLLPIIKKAHELGLYVITCDFLPNNIAHKYSDKYVNISIIDKNAVLEFAQKERINGIMSFACDPGVVTAAYVAETMGLPFQCSYKSACILQNKGLFRRFLLDNGFNSPHAKGYSNIDDVFKDIDYFTWPVIVKPVDSAGSKGVTKVSTIEELKPAIQQALTYSQSNSFIVEDFLEFKGAHSSADSFTIDGKLKFITYSDQLFDKDADNPYVPSLIIWPSTMEKSHQTELNNETQRLMTLLGMKHGIYNIETCIATNNKPYIMEVSPRGGGCRIAEIQQLAYGIDLIENEIRKAVSLPLIEINEEPIKYTWCELIIHAKPGCSGIFKELKISKEVKEKYLVDIVLTVKPGDYVKPFTGANMSLGDMFLKFNNRKELDYFTSHIYDWLEIVLE